MQRLRNPADERKILAALRRRNPGSLQDLELSVGGADVTGNLEGGPEREVERGKAGATLSFELDGRAPWFERGAAVRADVRTAGVRAPLFRGSVRVVKRRRGVVTCEAVTGGYWNGKVKLGEPRPYPRWRPEAVVWDAALRNKAYDHHHTVISPARVPTYEPSGGSPFSDRQPIGDVLEDVGNAASYLLFDNARGGLTARPYFGPAEAADDVLIGSLYVGAAGGLDALEFEPEDDGDEWYDVDVVREEALPGGGTRTLSMIRNPIRIPGTSAPEGATFFLDAAESDVGGGADPLDRAMVAARRLRRREHTLTAHLPYVHPLLEVGDGFRVEQPDVERAPGAPGGVRAVVVHWVAVVEAHNPLWATRQHRLDLRLVVDRVEGLAVPRIEPAPRSRLRPPPVRRDHRGTIVADPSQLPFLSRGADGGVRMNVSEAQRMLFDAARLEGGNVRWRI